MSLPFILLILALICFVLATFGVSFVGLSLGWLGLFFYVLSEVAGGRKQ
jgi:hypothetical protein